MNFSRGLTIRPTEREREREGEREGEGGQRKNKGNKK
jgi:hypothetical protein